MSKAESWICKDWEPKMAKQETDLNWMKQQYGATATEVSLEAIIQVLTNEIGKRTVAAIDGQANEDDSKQKEQLFALAESIESAPARVSLSEKHTTYIEREINGKIS